MEALACLMLWQFSINVNLFFIRTILNTFINKFSQNGLRALHSAALFTMHTEWKTIQIANNYYIWKTHWDAELDYSNTKAPDIQLSPSIDASRLQLNAIKWKRVLYLSKHMHIIIIQCVIDTHIPFLRNCIVRHLLLARRQMNWVYERRWSNRKKNNINMKILRTSRIIRWTKEKKNKNRS